MNPLGKTPLVSVCVPTYNGSEFVDACLEGLLGQNLKDLEVLVGDDQSTDGTLDVVRRRRDPRLRVLPFTTRAGMSRNWSRCLAEARGKYVALVAQDDLVRPQWGERLAQLLESHPEANLAFGRREFGFSDERTRVAMREFFEVTYPERLDAFYSRIGTSITPEEMIEAAMVHHFDVNLIGEPSFTMVRRDHPATRAGYHPDMKQLIDWEFAARFFLAGPIVHCPEVIGTYRLHAAGTSAGNSPLTVQHREYFLLLQSLLAHSPSRLDAANRARLRVRLTERQEILYAHVRDLEAHARNLETMVREREAHARNLEAHVENREEHVRNLEAHLRDLDAHAKNLEAYVRRIKGSLPYRLVVGVKDLVSRRPRR